DPVGGRVVDGGASGQRPEAGLERALFVQRRHRRQALFFAEQKVFLTAAWRDVDDARTFGLADVFPGDDAVGILRRHGGRPALLASRLGDRLRIAAGLLLGRQVVERAVVGPADHVGALDLAGDLEAALAFLEALLQRFQLRDALDPLLAL